MFSLQRPAAAARAVASRVAAVSAKAAAPAAAALTFRSSSCVPAAIPSRRPFSALPSGITPPLSKPAAATAAAPAAATTPTDNAPRRELSLPYIVVSGFGAGVIGVNAAMLHGSAVLTQSMAFAWRVARWSDVTPESLAFLHVLHPRPEFLLLGCGAAQATVSPATHAFLSALGVRYDVQPTAKAAGTFNLLNEEKRRVVACLVALDAEEHKGMASRTFRDDKRRGRPEWEEGGEGRKPLN